VVPIFSGLMRHFYKKMKQFTQKGKSAVYALFEDKSCACYFLRDTWTSAKQKSQLRPDTLSLEEAWVLREGYYIFTASPISEPTHFAHQALDCFHREGFQDGLVWVQGIPEEISDLTFTALKTYQCLDPYRPHPSRRLAKPQDFSWRNYYLAFQRQTQIILDIHDDIPVFKIRRGEHLNIFMRTRKWGERQFVVGPEVVIPLLNQAVGTFKFQARLDRDQVANFRIGLRFAWTNDNAHYKTVHYPIFDLPPPKPPHFRGSNSEAFPFEQPDVLELVACLDPLQAGRHSQALDPARTYFSLDQRPLPTYYQTSDGEQIFFVPQEAARLVFASNPDHQQPIWPDTYYLAPSGRFQPVIFNPTKTEPNKVAQAPNLVFGAGQAYDLLELGEETCLEFVAVETPAEIAAEQAGVIKLRNKEVVVRLVPSMTQRDVIAPKPPKKSKRGAKTKANPAKAKKVVAKKPAARQDRAKKT
jgi:hypothetical protein